MTEAIQVDSSSGFPSETQCNFELKFGANQPIRTLKLTNPDSAALHSPEGKRKRARPRNTKRQNFANKHDGQELGTEDLEGDEDLMSGAGDLFTSSQTPTAIIHDFGDHRAEDDRKTQDRKRKMDSEGFVTPATPDIPKSSMQYEPGGGESRNAGIENPNDGFHFTQQVPQQQQQQQQPLQQQQTQPRRKQKQQKQHRDVADTSEMNPSASQVSPKRFESASDMFEEVAQRTKMLIIQMAQNFRESEEYESVCLANVESLLIEAKDLENNLRHQKDILQQRIFMIGRRLTGANQ